jgi:teichuronic acid biosynthesis glycosyltransferase TuaG
VRSDPVVTVLTAVRNGARYLDETIASIQSQTMSDWEYVIVDDASDDATGVVVERRASADDRIRYLRREAAGGPYVAANDGLRVSRGRYVARIDGDDVACADRLERQVAFLEHSAFRACVGSWRWIDESGNVDGERQIPFRSPVALKWTLCVLPGIVHSTACVERNLLNEIGGYREVSAAADLGLWCELSRRDTLGLMDLVLVEYRRHGSQITSQRASDQRVLGADILKDHLQHLSGAPWTVEDADALQSTGRWFKTDYARGASMLRRWEAAWRADASLDAEARRELRAATTRVWMRHARVNAETLNERARGLGSVLARVVGLSR